jgi:hypothetical protein
MTPTPPDTATTAAEPEGVSALASADARTDAPASAGPARGLRPVHLVAVAAAIAGGALITLLAMGARPSAVATPHVEARRTAAVAATGKASPGIDLDAPAKWSSTHQARWVNPSRTAAAFEVAAERPVNVWNGSVTPTLVVRCTKGRVDAFVYTNSAARIEPEDENHTVRLVFDDDGGTHERWPDSVEHDALFAPEGRVLVDRLAAAQTLRFTFAPHNAGPATAIFDVRGLKAKMSKTRACQQK